MRFGRLLRLNFSKSGMSVGVGGPFYNVNFSKRGMRKTMGIPGTGVSYQTFERWPKRNAGGTPTLPQAAPSPNSTTPPPQSGSRAPFWIGVVLLVAATYACSHSPSKPTTTAKSYSGTPATPISTVPPASATPAPSSAGPASPVAPATLPIANNPLSLAEMTELQTLLQSKGFAPGPIDGYFGP